MCSKNNYLRRSISALVAVLFALLILSASSASAQTIAAKTFNQLAPSVSTTVVISQAYGGAGCGTAGCSSYKNDYIELFNRGASPQSLNGWSVQYTAGTGTAWQVTPLTNVTLQPGQYYLVGEGAGSNGVSNLPQPDTSGTIAMSATAGKVALVNTTTALAGACPISASVIDFLGFGATANCREGAANAPAPSLTTADVCAGGGCTDTDSNGNDFTATTPNPRNTLTALSPCTVTAAAVTISGRVIAGEKLGLLNALVTLTDTRGNSRTAFTGRGGAFSFEDVAAGEIYILNVQSKRYRYAPQVVSATEDLAGIVFSPQ